jgi:AraC-like DNA-binding protein
MDAAYEKIVIADPGFPVVILENDKISSAPRHSLCPLHWHEHLELHYIFEGTLHIRVNQTEYTLKQGDLVVINGNDTHSSWFTGRLKERILIFRPEDLSSKFSQLPRAYRRHIPQDATVSRLLEVFEREYITGEPGWEPICMGQLLQLLTHLVRNYPLTSVADPEETRRTQQMRRLLPVQNYIELHYNEEIPAQTLADLIYVSRDRFNHLFKACMGIPLRRYINDIRLHTAYRWLEQGLYPPAEAASRAGFTDYNHFGRLFRQTFGCTPSQVKPQNSKIV